ncbi:MAG: Ig-like domain-containing protein [Oscillospiraceae bacterium]|jgi:hypothetical protein|nr:Ig-like domain-containing protein [Oscillospiraceae bacterium]
MRKKLWAILALAALLMALGMVLPSALSLFDWLAAPQSAESAAAEAAEEAAAVALTLKPEELTNGEALAPGDVLRLAVYAKTTLPIYANYTIVYYNADIFEPEPNGGTAALSVQGEGIEEYLALNGSHPLNQIGAPLGDVNVPNPADFPPAWKDSAGNLLPARANYAAIALKNPYDAVNTPQATASADALFFRFALRVKATAPIGQSGEVLFHTEALRTETQPNAGMYYCTNPTSDRSEITTVSLSAPLEFPIEAAVANPVRLVFDAGQNGALSGPQALRNLPQGTTLAQLQGRLPVPAAQIGYVFAGWARQTDYEANPASCALVGENEPLTEAQLHLIAVFRPRPVRVYLYLTDARGAQQRIAVATLDLWTGADFSAQVPSNEELLAFADPIDPAQGYVFERRTPEGGYVVPVADDDEIEVEVGRIWLPVPPPRISKATLTLRYKETNSLSADDGARPLRWSSSNPKIVKVDPDNGSLQALGRGTAVVTVTDLYGTPSHCTVTVKYAWWQWLILIFLFGWIWY